MKQITEQYASERMRKECVAAPIDIKKIIMVFGDDIHELHQVLNLYHQGMFEYYHMIPGNGSKEF